MCKIQQGNIYMYQCCCYSATVKAEWNPSRGPKQKEMVRMLQKTETSSHYESNNLFCVEILCLDSGYVCSLEEEGKMFLLAVFSSHQMLIYYLLWWADSHELPRVIEILTFPTPGHWFKRVDYVKYYDLSVKFLHLQWDTWPTAASGAASRRLWPGSRKEQLNTDLENIICLWNSLRP